MKKLILLLTIFHITFGSINAYSLQYVYDYSGIITASGIVTTHEQDPFSVGNIGDKFDAQIILNDDKTVAPTFEYDLSKGIMAGTLFQTPGTNGSFSSSSFSTFIVANWEPIFFTFETTPSGQLLDGHSATDYVVASGQHYIFGADLDLRAVPVPEPSTFFLVLLGGGLILLYRKFKYRSD